VPADKFVAKSPGGVPAFALSDFILGISGFGPRMSADELVAETSDAASGSVLAKPEMAIVLPVNSLLSDGGPGFVGFGSRKSADEFVITMPDAAGISVFVPAAEDVTFSGVVPLFSDFCCGNSEIGPRTLADDTVVGLTDVVTPFVSAP
jgi:hypothetical protein